MLIVKKMSLIAKVAICAILLVVQEGQGDKNCKCPNGFFAKSVMGMTKCLANGKAMLLPCNLPPLPKCECPENTNPVFVDAIRGFYCAEPKKKIINCQENPEWLDGSWLSYARAAKIPGKRGSQKSRIWETTLGVKYEIKLCNPKKNKCGKTPRPFCSCPIDTKMVLDDLNIGPICINMPTNHTTIECLNEEEWKTYKLDVLYENVSIP